MTIRRANKSIAVLKGGYMISKPGLDPLNPYGQTEWNKKA